MKTIIPVMHQNIQPLMCVYIITQSKYGSQILELKQNTGEFHLPAFKQIPRLAKNTYRADGAWSIAPPQSHTGRLRRNDRRCGNMSPKDRMNACANKPLEPIINEKKTSRPRQSDVRPVASLFSLEPNSEMSGCTGELMSSDQDNV